MFALTRNNNRLSPWTSLADLHREFFDTFKDFEDMWAKRSYPAPQIESNDKEIKLTACLPGFDSKEIDIQLLNDYLTISAKHTDSKEEKKKNYLRSERFCGEYKESFKLGTKIDFGKAKANYKNGILDLTLPKAESEKPKKISING